MIPIEPGLWKSTKGIDDFGLPLGGYQGRRLHAIQGRQRFGLGQGSTNRQFPQKGFRRLSARAGDRPLLCFGEGASEVLTRDFTRRGDDVRELDAAHNSTNLYAMLNV